MIFARDSGQIAQLRKQLQRLAYFGHDPERVQTVLYKDFAPYSFSFQIEAKDNQHVFRPWISGGLVYHGPHDRYGSGCAPTFSVSLSPAQGWQIHT